MELPDRKVEEILILTRENNELLRKIRRSMRVATIFSMIYWLIIIGIAIGAYYVIQPYIEGAQNIYSTIDQQFNQIDQEFQGNLESFLNIFRKQPGQ